MNEFTLVKESLQLARRDLGLEEDLELEASENPYERLQEFLEIQIRQLLDRDFSGLLNAMYRIDMDENIVSEILEHSAPNELATNLAKAVLAREKQKVLTRQQYSQP